MSRKLYARRRKPRRSAVAVDALRGVRPHYTDRWTVIISSSDRLSSSSSGRRCPFAAHPDAEGTRLPAGSGESEEVSRTMAPTIEGPATPSRCQRTYSEVLPTLWVTLANNTRKSSPSRCYAQRTALDFTGRTIPRATSMWASPVAPVIFAAGMATKGYRPFSAIYSTFLQRASIPSCTTLPAELPVIFS